MAINTDGIAYPDEPVEGITFGPSTSKIQLDNLPEKEDSKEATALVAYSTLKDSMGRNRTKSLFIEEKHPKYPAPYTLKPYHHKGSMSMYLKYMEIGDPTEYSQAQALLGSWDHWQQLTNANWFKPYITKWRQELKVKMESDRFLEMKDVAENQAQTPSGIQATKWLAERYGEKETPTRGRPSQAEKTKAVRQAVEEEQLLQEERDRLGLA